MLLAEGAVFGEVVDSLLVGIMARSFQYPVQLVRGRVPKTAVELAKFCCSQVTRILVKGVSYERLEGFFPK